MAEVIAVIIDHLYAKQGERRCSFHLCHVIFLSENGLQDLLNEHQWLLHMQGLALLEGPIQQPREWKTRSSSCFPFLLRTLAAGMKSCQTVYASV